MLTGWRAALRIARGDALRARGRSALIVAMVALPVLALTFVVTLLEIYNLDPDEEATRRLGAADAAYHATSSGGPIVQRPGSRGSYSEPRGVGSSDRSGEPTDPRSVIPDGSRVIPSRENLGAQVRAHDKLYSVRVHELDYADPIAEGMVRQRAGRAPRAHDEVAVTTKLRDALGVNLGDTVRVAPPGRDGQRTLSLTVVGVVTEPDDLGKLGVVALPGTMAEHTKISRPQGMTTWLADTPEPVTWSDVRAANEKGVLVTSRSVLLDPPPRSAVSPAARQQPATNPMAIAIGVLVVTMAVLEVVLLAGAAFAVGTRRQARQLALLSVAGGDRRHVRRVVLASGVVLGTTGAIAGFVLGAAAAYVAAHVAVWFSWGSMPGRFGVPPLRAAGVVLLGVVTGLLAAFVPARGAARQNVVVALTGRRGSVRTKRRYPIIGLAMCLLGAALAGAGAAGHVANARFEAIGIAGGAVISQLGLVVAAPAIVGFASRFGWLLPATPRIALRDAGRNRSRAAPAMAAVMAAVAGASALAVFFVSVEDENQRSYVPETRMGQVTASVYDMAAEDRAAIRETVSSTLPVTQSALLRAATLGACDESGPCGNVHFGKTPRYRRLCGEADASGPGRHASSNVTADERQKRCRDWSGGSVTVGDAHTVQVLTGTSPPRIDRFMQGGGVAIFDNHRIENNTAYLKVERYDSSAPEESHFTTKRVPAVHIHQKLRRKGGVISLEAARERGFTVHPSALLFDTSRTPTRDEVAKAEAALEDRGFLHVLHVERGYQGHPKIELLVLMAASAIITLGASAIATGLALADGRADQATLGAVGASPRVRRVLAASQAGTISWLGSGLGILAGLIPGIAVVWAASSLPGSNLRIVIPWASLALVLVAVPLLAMLASLAFTRSRLSLVRRPE